MRVKLKTTIFAIVIIFSCFVKVANAQFSLIRDAQTEKFLRELSTPIFLAANINPDEISIYIVNDDSINAFVSGGRNIFINTGLIRKFKTPDALIGVVAHEVGHITGGHIARSSEEIEAATNTMLIGYILGIGAAIAGSPEAAQGLILGGSNVAEKLYLKYSRSQEESADKNAAKYLEKMHYPANGLIELLEFFESQSRGYKGFIDEYSQSHPVSKKRIDYLKNNAKFQADNSVLNAKLQAQMNVILYKLEGFIDDANDVIKKYQNDNSFYANYAKSIAFYRKGQINQSLILLDKLIEEKQNDGFLFELKAQILQESGNSKDAIINYQKSLQLLDFKDSSQAKIYFANAILNLDSSDFDLINLAIKNLKEAKKFEKENPFLFKNLAKAYNKIGDKARSFAALAEYNFLISDNKKAKKYCEIAKEEFLKDKKKYKFDLIKLEDLIEMVNNIEKKKK